MPPLFGDGCSQLFLDAALALGVQDFEGANDYVFGIGTWWEKEGCVTARYGNMPPLGEEGGLEEITHPSASLQTW